MLNLSQRIGAAAGPISAMALLAAIVVVTNTVLVSVTTRTREIGVRRALGASRQQIMQEVLSEAVVVAVAGGAVGVVCAAGLVRLLATALGVPIDVSAQTLVVAMWRRRDQRHRRRLVPGAPGHPARRHRRASHRMMPGPASQSRTATLGSSMREAGRLAWDSLRSQPARSGLAIAGVVIGIVTVVLVASVLVGLRNSVAQLFRELGTDNIFVFHRNGDPYTPASERDALRRPLRPAFAETIRTLGPSVLDVGVQLLVPAVSATRVITARAGGNESDTVLIEGVSPNFFEVTGAEFASGRPFSDAENRVVAPVAVIGANVAVALFGGAGAVGQPFLLGGQRYFVVGVLAKRRGTFFGENRNDNVVSMPVATARRRFPEAENTVLYVRAETGLRDRARDEAETILRLLRGVGPDEPSDFQLSTRTRSSRSSTGSAPRSSWPRSAWRRSASSSAASASPTSW